MLNARMLWQEVRRLGPRETFHKMRKMREIKWGRLVGTDTAGNKYFENPSLIYTRRRWVEYARKDHDPSQIPAEWSGWLHYTTDENPVNSEFFKKFPAWKEPHRENYTGTNLSYRPANHPLSDQWQPTARSAQNETWTPSVTAEPSKPYTAPPLHGRRSQPFDQNATDVEKLLKRVKA